MCTFVCLHMVNLRATPGATPAFSTNTLYNHVYNRDIPHASRGGQAAVGYIPRQSVDALSSSEHSTTVCHTGQL